MRQLARRGHKQACGLGGTVSGKAAQVSGVSRGVGAQAIMLELI
jgi:hypothetical protein